MNTTEEFLDRWLPYALLLVPVVLFLGVTAFPIYIVDEARNAQAAWEMTQREDWITPTFNEYLRADKPPLHYWAMRLAYGALGKTPLAARLGSLLCGLLVIGFVYVFTRRWAGPRAGGLAALLLGFGLYVPLQFKLATPDPYLTLSYLAGNLLLYRYLARRRWGLLGAGYLLLAAGVLAKGPVILLLSGLGWLLFCLWRPVPFWRTVVSLRPWLGAFIIGLLTLPWFLAVDAATAGEFTRVFFWEHNLERFAETREGHGGPFWLVIVMALLALFPAGLLAPAAVADRFVRRAEAGRFALSFAAAPLLFFAFSSTKLPSYPFPAVPFLAVLTGAYLDRLLAGRPVSRLAWWGTAAVLAVMAALPAGILLGLRQDAVLRDLTGLGWQFAYLTPLALLAARWAWSGRRLRTFATVAATWIVFSLHLWTVLPRSLTTHNQVVPAARLLADAPRFVAYGRFAPALVYELDRYVPGLDSVADIPAYLRTAPSGTLLLTAERYRDDLPAGYDLREVFRQKDLFEYPTTLIFEYHAPPPTSR